jgi:hypothetical protein
VGHRGSCRWRPSWSDRCLAECATAAFVDGRGSRLGAGRTPRAGAGAPAASGSRSWCRRRGYTARPRRPARGRWRGRRRAAPRTAPVALRSAGPSPGRAKSPPNQVIERMFENASARLLSPTGPLRVWVVAATRRNPGTTTDSRANECRDHRAFAVTYWDRNPRGALSRQQSAAHVVTPVSSSRSHWGGVV